jgi:eukaryotic-like serine/threonine-protein kinase
VPAVSESSESLTIRPDAVVAGRFRLLHPLGQGGMASIWAARDIKLDSDVAVKFLDPDLAASQEAAERFQREALAVSRIASIHVVRVIDYGVTEHQEPYMILERLHGYDLDELLEREVRLPLRTVAQVVKQACRALASAHEAGVIHRDIKPANLFLTEDGPEFFVHVLDFGVAKMEASRGKDARKLTRPDELLGTLEYMSPEQVLGSDAPLDGRADLYALGVVAYRALTGEAPFKGDALGELLLSLTQKPMRPVSSICPELPPALDGWFAKALALDRDARFLNAQEMGQALRTIEESMFVSVPPGPNPQPRSVASVKKQEPAPTPATLPASKLASKPAPGTTKPLRQDSSPATAAKMAQSGMRTLPPKLDPPAPVAEEGSAVREKVLDAFGKHRQPVEKMMSRANYELEAWTPDALRNRKEPLPQLLVSLLTGQFNHLWLHHRDALLVAVGLVGALTIVVLGFLLFG